MKQLKYKHVLIINAIFYVVLGVFVFIFCTMPFNTLAILFGVRLLVGGALKIISYITDRSYFLPFRFDLAAGIVSVLLGVLLLLRPGAILSTVPISLAVLMFFEGVMKVQLSIEMKRKLFDKWWVNFVLALLCIVASLSLLSYSTISSRVLLMYIGIAFAVDGLMDLWTAWYVSKAYEELEGNRVAYMRKGEG